MDDYHRAFKELKQRLTEALVLAYYHPKHKTMLETNALDGVLASVLS